MSWFKRKGRQKRYLELEKRFRWKYENLRNLLRLNSALLETISDIQSYTGGRIPEDAFTQHQISNLIDGTEMMIANLNRLSDNEFYQLYKTLGGIAGKIQILLHGTMAAKNPPLLLPLNLAGRGLIDYVGGKAGHLGELKNVVAIAGNIPDGFVVTTAAYHMLLNENNLIGHLRALYSKIDVNNLKETDSICSGARRFIENSIIPEAITAAIERYIASAGCAHECTWAVRSSAVGEDGEFSFAGQFESMLNVPRHKLAGAYLKVVASRFNTNAVMFRLMKNIREAESPMAVLFIPMVKAVKSGVIYTGNPEFSEDNNIIISAVRGLAVDLVAGRTNADTFYVDRQRFEISKQFIEDKRTMMVASGADGLERKAIPETGRKSPSLTAEQIRELTKIALKIESHFGFPQDIEWAIDEDGSYKIIQSRPLRIEQPGEKESETQTECRLLAEGGATIFPGVAQGQLQSIDSKSELEQVREGVILLTRQAEPEIASIFPRISGLISETGHPTGHAATLARDFKIPTLFNLDDAMRKLKGAVEIGLDATRRKVYAGLPWPDLPQRAVKEVPDDTGTVNPMDELIFNLNLTDPEKANFTPGGCRSLHDIIRYAHEKAVTALFDLSDSQVERLKESFKTLDSEIPLHLTVLIIGDAINEKYDRQKSVAPEGINSIPFQALWKGISNPEISWTGRQNINLSGLASVIMSSAIGDGHSGRQMGDRNYIIVSPEYLNLNARLAYHYSMIDALVCDRAVNNHITFRFRGGGAGRTRRCLRARFLTDVLLYSCFSVDLREDLLTARYRGYSREACEEKLEMLGKLTGCARQLDMLMDSNETVKIFVDRFLSSDYKFFH
jgi:pyruvate,water dikinase